MSLVEGFKAHFFGSGVGRDKNWLNLGPNKTEVKYLFQMIFFGRPVAWGVPPSPNPTKNGVW